jgi:hypothetical protein
MRFETISVKVGCQDFDVKMSFSQPSRAIFMTPDEADRYAAELSSAANSARKNIAEREGKTHVRCAAEGCGWACLIDDKQCPSGHRL